MLVLTVVVTVPVSGWPAWTSPFPPIPSVLVAVQNVALGAPPGVKKPGLRWSGGIGRLALPPVVSVAPLAGRFVAPPPSPVGPRCAEYRLFLAAAKGRKHTRTVGGRRCERAARLERIALNPLRNCVCRVVRRVARSTRALIAE